MKVKRVLVVAQEIFPYLPKSEISESTRELLLDIQNSGTEIRTFMPRYGVVNERRNQLHEVIRLSGMNIIIDDSDHPLIIKVASIPSTRIQVYFIDNEDYFLHRDVAADNAGSEYADNDERAIFFARGVIETVKKLRWTPDVIHCHGWITSLVPLYIKSNYSDDPSFRDAKIVYSAYSDKFELPWSSHFVDKLGMDGINLEGIGLSTTESVSHSELIKLAMRFSDGVIASSKDVAGNIEEYAKTIGKSFFSQQEGDKVSTYSDFYEEVCR